MASFVPSGVAGLLGLTGRSWQDRIREASYTSPKGTKILFEYEDVGREFELRGTAFDYPGVNNSYVQQNGFGSRRYPLRVFFSGPDHDRIATAFEAALSEPGVGTLEHPLYGKLDVVPFGTVTRNDNLKSAANQSVIEVTFWTTLGVVYPSAGVSGQNEILAAIAGFDVEAAQQFEDATDLVGAVKAASAKAAIRKFLRDVSGALQAASDAVLSVNREFRDIQSLVNQGLDVAIGKPLLLAQQIGNLIKAPARALAGLQSRLEGYKDLADRIFGSPQGNPARALAAGAGIANRNGKVTNDFCIADLFALNAVAGSVLSVVGDAESETLPFNTKPQALAAADAIEAQLAAATAWRDEGFRALEETGHQDSGQAQAALQHAVAVALGHLVQVSFTLVPERRVVLDRPRTVVDLCAELYGTVDSRLDFLIQTNDLTGSEIFELPRGRAVVYYP